MYSPRAPVTRDGLYRWPLTAMVPRRRSRSMLGFVFTAARMSGSALTSPAGAREPASLAATSAATSRSPGGVTKGDTSRATLSP